MGALARDAAAADHNDPNAVNSIFADIPPDPADLYDMFGFPSDDTSHGDAVVVALTFAAMPRAGVLDGDYLYRILFAPTPRPRNTWKDGAGPEDMLEYFEGLKKKYLALKPAEVRVTVGADGRATVQFNRFPGGSFQAVIPTNQVANIDTPDKQSIKAFIGGRDDAFFNDLPGFFRSINYGPQFYHVPHDAPMDLRELPIPKTLLELEGNTLFNFDPAKPTHGQGLKLDMPAGPHKWTGDKFAKDKNGNFRFVYSGKDAQAGRNINAIILELPLRFLTASPNDDRIVNTWGESWVLKASSKVETIPDDRAPLTPPFWIGHPWALAAIPILLGAFLLLRAMRGGRHILPAVLGILLIGVGIGAGSLVSKLGGQKPELTLRPSELDAELDKYKLVDTDGQPFADAALNQRADEKQLGAYNFWLGPSFVTRLAHLGWGFGPSISALGLKTSFDHDNSPVSVHKEVTSLIEAFPRVRKVIFQQLNMPDATWNKKGLDIPLRRAVEIFIPNVCAIDMDTTGTWPFGRRLEDQVATRFLSLFLDMSAELDGKKYNIETLSQQALWDKAPIEPKTPPNPLKNDKEFSKTFPYLAEPW